MERKYSTGLEMRKDPGSWEDICKDGAISAIELQVPMLFKIIIFKGCTFNLKPRL